MDSAGTILVVDANGGTGFLGALFTVNPSTGARTIVSDFGNAAQGPLGTAPRGLTVDSGGTILVIDSGNNSVGTKLFAVNRNTGSRTIISDFQDPIKGPLGVIPTGVVTFNPGAAADNFPPDTTIVSAVDSKGRRVSNGAKTGSTAIKVTFTGTDNVAVDHFQCSLDGAAFSGCSSPISYSNLRGGTHVLQVRAVDTSGLVDPTPAVVSWFISGKTK